VFIVLGVDTLLGIFICRGALTRKTYVDSCLRVRAKVMRLDVCLRGLELWEKTSKLSGAKGNI